MPYWADVVNCGFVQVEGGGPAEAGAPDDPEPDDPDPDDPDPDDPWPPAVEGLTEGCGLLAEDGALVVGMDAMCGEAMSIGCPSASTPLPVDAGRVLGTDVALVLTCCTPHPATIAQPARIAAAAVIPRPGSRRSLLLVVAPYMNNSPWSRP